MLPNNTQSAGAKRYTYNSAGYLTEVESHNGTNYTAQATMTYNGLGQRQSMDASGVIAYYVMDGNRPLTAESNGNTTTYLYGVGVIGEENNTWSYSLTDGTNYTTQAYNGLGTRLTSSAFGITTTYVSPIPPISQFHNLQSLILQSLIL